MEAGDDGLTTTHRINAYHCARRRMSVHDLCHESWFSRQPFWSSRAVVIAATDMSVTSLTGPTCRDVENTR